MKSQMIMLVSAAMGNGTRQVGDVIADIESDDIAALIAEIQQKRSITKLTHGTVILAEGAAEIEVVNCCLNARVARIGKADEVSPVEAVGPVVDPSLLNKPTDEWRALSIVEVGGIANAVINSLAGANIRTLGEVADHIAAKGALSDIEGVGIESEKKILQAIATLKA